MNTGTFLPLMINPHQVLDYDNWWNKSLNNIKPYRIPPLSNDIVTKLHKQLDASSDRIWRTRSAEKATKIIQILRALIKSHTEEHSKYPTKIMLLCCIYFKLFPIGNYLFSFPTNRRESILLKKWQ